MSSVRPVLPGMAYTHVPAQDRLNIYTAAPSEIVARLRAGKDAELSKALLGALEGMSPLVCREIAHNAARGGGDARLPAGRRTGDAGLNSTSPSSPTG